jgi:hypothetical protein
VNGGRKTQYLNSAGPPRGMDQRSFSPKQSLKRYLVAIKSRTATNIKAENKLSIYKSSNKSFK